MHTSKRHDMGYTELSHTHSLDVTKKYDFAFGAQNDKNKINEKSTYSISLYLALALCPMHLVEFNAQVTDFDATTFV